VAVLKREELLGETHTSGKNRREPGSMAFAGAAYHLIRGGVTKNIKQEVA